MQVDSHLPELTVRETLDFASRVQGPGSKRGALNRFHHYNRGVSCHCFHGVGMQCSLIGLCLQDDHGPSLAIDTVCPLKLSLHAALHGK